MTLEELNDKLQAQARQLEQMRRLLDEQRETIADGKAQWNKVAGILGVDGDNVDAVIFAARSLTTPIEPSAQAAVDESHNAAWADVSGFRWKQ